MTRYRCRGIDVEVWIDVEVPMSRSKYQDADKISKYFSGILSFNDNKYANSYDYLRTLEGLEDNHLTYSKLYQYSLINLEKFVEAYRYSKKLEKKGLDSFESNLIILFVILFSQYL